jgi:peptide deformylase
MAVRKIIEYPDPVLRHTAESVNTFDESLRILVADMAETMYAAPGIGLAAPQVAVSQRVIVVDVSKGEEEKQFLPMVNPEIIEHEGSQLDEEGCLSVPELTAQVKRFKKIQLSYQSPDGEHHELSAEDRFAVVLQHEIDHLNGVLFIDHLTPLKRSLYKKRRKKMLETQQAA